VSLQKPALVPGWDEGLVEWWCRSPRGWGGAATLLQVEDPLLPTVEGPRERAERRGGRSLLSQRQRIDITRPATISPNPMAKFHGPMADMNGMLSPAT
jgi:hypothetical protein